MATSRTLHRASRTRRSRREWAGRTALACGLAVLGYGSVAFSVAQVAARSQPKRADAIVSYDGRLLAAHAAALLTAPLTAVGRGEAAALSRAALRRDPTSVAAVATLGVVTLGQGRTGEARRLLAYAQMLSRRNVTTQLWSIEDAIAREDVAGALRWYDVALRTKPAMSDVLYPVLAQASGDPEIRVALVRTLAGRPLWADSYVDYAAGQRSDPRSTVALFVALRQRGIAVPEAARSAVVNALLEGGQPDEAWRYYATLHPGVNRSSARDSNFAAMPDAPSLFDWIPVNDGNVSASIQRTRMGGTLEFSAPASIGGAVLQQVQLLPSGTYRLAGHSEGITQDARALPYWTLTCRNDGRELGRVTLPSSAQASGMFSGVLTVPANCPAQTLTLFAPASDAIGGMSGQIDHVILVSLT